MPTDVLSPPTTAMTMIVYFAALAVFQLCLSPLALFSHIAQPADAIRVAVFGPQFGVMSTPMRAVLDGLEMSFYDQNNKGGLQGKPIEWVFRDLGSPPDPNLIPPSPTELLDEWMGNESTRIDCLAIPPGGPVVEAVAEAARKYNLTVFGPSSGERYDFLHYTTSKVLIVPMPDIEIAALIRYMVFNRNLRRIAVLASYGTTMGHDLVGYISSLLAEFGLELAHLYVAGQPGVSNMEVVYGGAHKRVQGLIQLGMLDENTIETIVGIYTTMPLADDWIIASPLLTFPILTNVFSQLPAGSIGRGNLLSTLYSPFYSDPSAKSSREFMRSMEAHQDVLVFKPFMYSGAANVLASFAFMGYIAAEMIINVVKELAPQQSILDKAFSGWLIPAHEMVLGPYSKPCEDGRTIACGCHSGVRNVNLATTSSTLDFIPLPEAKLDISMDTCLPINFPIQSPLIQLVASPTVPTTAAASSSRLAFSPASIAAASLLTEEVVNVIGNATEQFVAGDIAGYGTASVGPTSRTGIRLARSYASLDALVDVQQNRLTTLSVGSVFVDGGFEAHATDLTVILDPLVIEPPLYTQFAERVVYLGPTLQQEIHALTSQYAVVNVLTATADDGLAKGLLRACTRSSHTFGRAYGGYLMRSAGGIAEGITSLLGRVNAGGASTPSVSSGVLLVHGVRSALDLAAIDDYLASRPSAVVALPFQHVTLWYDVLMGSIDESRRGRIVFVTNLPHWEDAATANVTATATVLMRQYQASMEAAGLPYTPQTMRGFLAQRLIANVVERIPTQLTQDSFLSTLYAVSVVFLDQLYSIGPLNRAACDGESGRRDGLEDDEGGSSSSSGTTKVSSSHQLCETNVGARAVNVRSLSSSSARAADISQFVFATGGVEYKGLPSEEGMATYVIVLIVCGSFIVLLLCVMFLLWAFTGRSHWHAPKDSTVPFTIIFTDIQSSTGLWAEVPEAMGQALVIHHKLIRKLISKHNGYEVKTIGDAFMIAFKSADDAVALAFSLQHVFHGCADFSPLLDSTLIRFDTEKLAEDPTLRNLSCQLPPDAYERVWRGLRVRVGINTAVGSIQKDPVTNAYDYYGTVTNTAARVEAVSHGGQVCFTEDTLHALRRTELTILDPMAASRSHHFAMSRSQMNASGSVAPLPPPNHMLPSMYAADPALLIQYDSPTVAIRLGPQDLRGLSQSVTMYQLECLVGRVYPPLRLESAPAEEGLLDEDDEAAELGTLIGADEVAVPGLFVDLPMDEGGANKPSPALAMVLAVAPSDESNHQQEAHCSRLAAMMTNPLNPSESTGTHPGAARSDSPQQQQLASSKRLSISLLTTGPNKSSSAKHNSNKNTYYGNNASQSVNPNASNTIAADNNANGDASMTGAGRFVPPSDVVTVQVMTTIMTLLSRIVSQDKRAKELATLCELWGVHVDARLIERARHWQVKPPPLSAPSGQGAATLHTTEDAVNHSVAMQLTKEDPAVAAQLDQLAYRVAGVASRTIRNATGPWVQAAMQKSNNNVSIQQ